MKLTDHAWPPAGFERTFVGSGATLTDLTDVKPRCAATDPTCGPDPYRSEHACYDPSAPRIPIQAPNDDGNARKRCAHDGECVRTACTTCTHYSVALGVSCAKKADIDFEEKEGVLCGCVDGGCWFFQN
jgi:hypothetical protein